MHHGVRSWCFSVQKWVQVSQFPVTPLRTIGPLPSNATGLFPAVALTSLQVSSIISASSSIVLLYFFLSIPLLLSWGGLPTLCTAEESFLSVCLIHFRSLICTPTGFSCACLHTSSFEPITIRNILCDRINPCLNPGITGKGAVHFPPCTIWHAKAS